MIADRSDYDVAIVGASIAGCAAATLLGRLGARVALLERRTDPAAFKRVCGHYIQASGVPVLKRLGIRDELEVAGAHRGRARAWSRFGWMEGDDVPVDRGAVGPEIERRSLNIRRQVLDPLLRRIAAATPGVDLLLGSTVEGLIADGGRVAGIEVSRRGARRTCVRARVVVGADGRRSATAKLAGIKTRTSVNRRFGYWGYFDGPGLDSDAAVQLWFLEPDVAIATPTDAGLTMYVAFPDRSRLAEFKRDTEGALRAFISALPDAPPIADSRLAGPIVGKLDLTNEWRPPAGPGLALVGDAALAADPVGAVGCGWALQSAEWLAESLASALDGAEPIARGLRRYARRHRRELRGHRLITGEFARSATLSPVQRVLFSAAVDDPVTADRVDAFAARLIRPHQLLAPTAFARAVAVNARRRTARRPRLAVAAR